jgi:hypothetical protein
MLPNEIFALACRAYYDEIGLIVDASNGQFAHSPLTKRECDTGYYLLWGHHQHQGLLQSKDLNKCCFFIGHAKKWLQECDYFPEGYFELWDIYDKYVGENGKKTAEIHRENGTGIFSPGNQKKVAEINRKNGTGIYDPEVRRMGLEAVRKSGTGVYDPAIRDKGIKAAQEVHKKPIELTRIKTGERFVFPSKIEAANALNLDQASLGQVCRGNYSQTGGYTARYL